MHVREEAGVTRVDTALERTPDGTRLVGSAFVHQTHDQGPVAQKSE